MRSATIQPLRDGTGWRYKNTTGDLDTVLSAVWAEGETDAHCIGRPRNRSRQWTCDGGEWREVPWGTITQFPRERTKEDEIADLERDIADMRREIESRQILLAMMERDLRELLGGE